MKIGVLTSSRADFGIYEPLINELISDGSFEVEIIAFGTHLSKYHGYTLKNIKDNYELKVHEISSLIVNDDKSSVSTAYGLTGLKFSEFWDKNIYDLVFCLGDRFEMSAAVQAGIPFGVKFAHIHGGEKTLGATDNIYRHQITLASSIHFTATNAFKLRVEQLVESEENVFNVGALSLSEVKKFIPVNKTKLFAEFNLKDEPYCLITFHPETNAFNENENFAMEMKTALELISQDINLVITMPNADTMGTLYREQLLQLEKENSNNVMLIENFGKNNYFSAMKYAKILIGNTSSGIIEAASFGKYVVNVGGRQEGRVQSENIYNAVFDKADIIDKTKIALKSGDYLGENVYYQSGTAMKIKKIIKSYEKF